MPSRHAKLVIDPAVPDETAELLRQHRKDLVRLRGGWKPAHRRRNPAVRIVVKIILYGMAITATGAALGFFQAAHYTLFALIMTGVAFLFMVGVIKNHPDAELERYLNAELDIYEQATAWNGHYVLGEDLDHAAAALMYRAHNAIETVTESRVNTEGLLDGVRNAVMLPAQEWEIARLLAKLSGLRAEHREVIAEGVTPEVAAVTGPLGRVLDSSEAAVLARVEALERYAGHVKEAERAFRARHQIERLRERLPRYEELLAESGADETAVPELSKLTEDADRLEQALRDSVSSARDAFRYLEP
ncbi:hypothetical protein OIE66_20300 [Nonomuraea sp. NBC_01738]|uniref:hypothetical protein n=1 Tax=Nonomuraea sp. NBC_01738 TaxID=2976003 RepID=UPI002E110B90|nr:hypothetical protein OIE66_20300 [Nonomuraea sp. NBC_01738]